MPRIYIPSLACAALLVTSIPLAGQSNVFRSAHQDYVATPVAEGLIRPWAVAFLPDGDMLITERDGRLRVVRDGHLLPEPVAGVPEVHAQGQGGLLDVVPHPEFASNRMLYLTYSKPLGDGESTTALIRGHFDGEALTEVEELFEAVSRGRGHYGSRIVFDGNGYVFISIGDRQVPPQGDPIELEAHPAQDLSTHHGTIVRLHDDGRVPEDNPFVGEAGALPEIWSYGHRNPQGMAQDPETGQLWANEHGPQGGDEVNRIQAGNNYGWPVVGYGVNYRSGSAIHEGTHRDGMTPPEHVWVPSIGTSGMMFYTGSRFPAWQGNAFVGGMVGQQLARLELSEDRQTILREETLYFGEGRIRDVRQGPDGSIYLAMDHRAGQETAIIRLDPAGS